MYTCAQCAVQACGKADPEALPKNCPMRGEALMRRAQEAYRLPENREFYITASELEALGYCQGPGNRPQSRRRPLLRGGLFQRPAAVTRMPRRPISGSRVIFLYKRLARC